MKKLSALRDTFLAADEACEKAREDLLQSAADVADASCEVFKALPHAIQEHKQNNPFDPRLEEWEDQLENWAEGLPKEQEK